MMIGAPMRWRTAAYPSSVMIAALPEVWPLGKLNSAELPARSGAGSR